MICRKRQDRIPFMNTHFFFILVLVLALRFHLAADVYFLDSVDGRDTQTGIREDQAWQSFGALKGLTLKPGDSIRLKRGSVFEGKLTLRVTGSADAPIVVEAYGEGALPRIEAHGKAAGVAIVDSQHVIVQDLEITADAALSAHPEPVSRSSGVEVHATEQGSFAHITLRRLFIHNIFPTLPREHEGIRSTTYLGNGITVEGSGEVSASVLIEACRIETTGFKAIELKRVQQVQVLDNHMHNIGGPAIQPGWVKQLVVRGNTVDGSGASSDPRMHGRGSGIWPWTSEDVLIEHNRFMHARGPGDSCGIHIDFNCRDVIVQYNLSYENEGGFIEILGNNHNCAYRYNISVNDGYRVKGEEGAFQEGKILWTSGYVGRDQAKHGPYHSYIYNNTAYVKPGGRSCFSISPTTQGLLVANNLFVLQGPVLNVSGDQDRQVLKDVERIPGALVTHNLFLQETSIPENLPVDWEHTILGDPQFMNPGGTDPADYLPINHELITDAGIEISPLPGDAVGLRIGLKPTLDILGNPIRGLPDLGAIELP